MAERPKREIEEIIELHIREGDQQKEVFVEGSEDKFILRSFLNSRSLGHVAVLEINTVNVPTAEVLALGQKDGCKGRVVTLAAKLEGRVATNEVVCIADADTDHVLDRSYQYSLLLITDGTSIELYALHPVAMDKILNAGLKGFPKHPNQVITELRELLESSFFVRAAAETLGLDGSYPKEHSSFCHFDKRTGQFSFHLRDYCFVVFGGIRDRNWLALLNSRVAELKIRESPDPRVQIHGHDFCDTFGWYIRQHKNYAHLNKDTLATVLLGMVDFDHLEAEPLFQELLARLRARA